MIQVPEGEVEVLKVSGRINAEPVVAALRANDIPARLVGEALGSVYGLTLDGLGEVAILVPSEHEERARELLADAEARGLEVDESSVEPSLANLGPRPPDESGSGEA